MSERPLGLTIAGALNFLGFLWGIAFGAVGMTMDGSSPDASYKICSTIIFIGTIFSLIGAVNTLRMKKYSIAIWSSGIAMIFAVSIFNMFAWVIIWGYKKHFFEHRPKPAYRFEPVQKQRYMGDPRINNIESQRKPANDPEENKVLSSSVNLYVPNFTDPHTSSDMIVEFINNSERTLENVHVDFSILAKYFDIDAGLIIGTLTAGMKLKKAIRIIPKYEEGTFPVKITITSMYARIENEYTIKVGGTEIY